MSAIINQNDDGDFLSVLGVGCRCIDLSHELNAKTIIWPGSGEGFNLCMRSGWVDESSDFWYASGSFSCGEHSGTHVDAPWHFSKKGKTVELLSVSQLIAPCRVIDISPRCAADPNTILLPEDILQHESEYGPISPNSIVLIKTGWAHFYHEGALKYLGYDEATSGPFNSETTTLVFPGIGLAAAQLLIDRGVKGVGIDTASLDPGSSALFETHRLLLGHGIFGIENLSSSINEVPHKGATCLVFPVKLTGGSGAPARVVIFAPQPESSIKEF